jgi:hypothetical protein
MDSEQDVEQVAMIAVIRRRSNSEKVDDDTPDMMNESLQERRAMFIRGWSVCPLSILKGLMLSQ